MRHRGSLLILVFIGAIGLAACGRATSEEINQALGITPTATLSAAEITAASANATSTAEARAAAMASPGATALGDATLGKRQFSTWCAGCHRAGGTGPDILSPGSPGSAVNADSLMALVRTGEGHAKPPGPYKTTQLSDKAVLDLLAYLQTSPGK